MPKILASYAVNVDPLPPEGSEEWLAMLPGWSGWIYRDRPSNVYMIRTQNYDNLDKDIGAVYWNIYEGKTGDITTSNRGYVGAILYCKIGSYYYFRGKLMKEDYSHGRDAFEIARATSLTPQR